MNKTQLIDALAASFEGNRRAAAHALDAVLDTITREVAKGEKVGITGFGSFEKRMRDARWVRNPQTGDRVQTAPKAVPLFRPGAELKNVVSGAKKLPAMTVAAATAPMRAAAASAARLAAGAGTEAPVRKTAATKSTATKSAATKSAATKSDATKSAAKKSPAKKSTAKKSAATTSAAAKKSTAKKSSSSATKSTAKKSTAKKSTAKKSGSGS